MLHMVGRRQLLQTLTYAFDGFTVFSDCFSLSRKNCCPRFGELEDTFVPTFAGLADGFDFIWTVQEFCRSKPHFARRVLYRKF